MGPGGRGRRVAGPDCREPLDRPLPATEALAGPHRAAGRGRPRRARHHRRPVARAGGPVPGAVPTDRPRSQVAAAPAARGLRPAPLSRHEPRGGRRNAGPAPGNRQEQPAPGHPPSPRPPGGSEGMTLGHGRHRRHVSLLAAGALPEGRERTLAEAHLDSCARCREDYRTLRAVLELTARDPVRAAEPPLSAGALTTRVLARLDSAAPAATRRRAAFWLVPGAAAAAAV